MKFPKPLKHETSRSYRKRVRDWESFTGKSAKDYFKKADPFQKSNAYRMLNELQWTSALDPKRSYTTTDAQDIIKEDSLYKLLTKDLPEKGEKWAAEGEAARIKEQDRLFNAQERIVPIDQASIKKAMQENDQINETIKRQNQETSKSKIDTAGDAVNKVNHQESQNDVSKSYFNANNIIETPLFQETGSDPFVIPYTQYEKAGERQSQSKGSVAKNQKLLKDMRNEGKLDIAPWTDYKGIIPAGGYGGNPDLKNAWDKTIPTNFTEWDIKDLPLIPGLFGSG